MSDSQLSQRLHECGYPSTFHLCILIPLWALQIAAMITYFNVFITDVTPLITLAAAISLVLTSLEILAYFGLPSSDILTASFMGNAFLFSNLAKSVPWTIISFSAIWEDQHYTGFLSGVATFVAVLTLVVFYLPLIYAVLVWEGQRRTTNLGYENISSDRAC